MRTRARIYGLLTVRRLLGLCLACAAPIAGAACSGGEGSTAEEPPAAAAPPAATEPPAEAEPAPAEPLPVGVGVPPEQANWTLAFSSDRDGDQEIYLMRGDGSGLVQLTHNKADDSEPT